MDYIQHQQDAKAENRWLLAAFGLIITIVAAAAAAVLTGSVWMVAVLIEAFSAAPVETGAESEVPPELAIADFPWGWTFVVVCLIVWAVIGGVSTARERALVRFGGVGLARSLGGRHVHNQSADLAERRFVNAVEEIAIAARQPLPAVFVLDNESGINVFNAGWTPESTVVGITSGALSELTREELQAVAAQAMSHVFHGDARLNMRLMALVTGVAGIAIIGEDWVEKAQSGERRDEDRLVVPLFVAGVFLRTVGWLGVWLSNSVQRYVARRHEFLADATAVELLRLSEPMRDALRRIGAHPAKSRVRTQRARTVSHLFMADTRGRHKGGIHPDLRLRILRLDPSWTGDWLQSKSQQGVDPRGWTQAPAPEAPSSTTSQMSGHSLIAGVGSLEPLAPIFDPLAGPMSGIVGGLPATNDSGAGVLAPVMGAAIASEALAAPPSRQPEAEFDGDQGRALVSALVHRAASCAPTQDSVPHGVSLKRVQTYLDTIGRGSDVDRLGLLRLAVDGIESSDAGGDPAQFAKAATACLQPDDDLDHWLLQRLISLMLCPQEAPKKSRRLEALRHEYALVLSFMTTIGGGDASIAFSVGSSAAGLNGMALRRVRGLRDLDKALSRLRLLHPRELDVALAGFEAAMDADMRQRPQEREFIEIVKSTMTTA